MGKYILKFKYLILLLITGLMVVGITTSYFSNSQKNLTIDWEPDLELLKQEMLNNEISFQGNDVRSKEFAQKVDTIIDDISNFRNDDEVRVAIAKAVASLEQGHTKLTIWDEKFIPIRLYMIDDKLYVIATIDQYYDDIIYLELTKINDHPVQDVIVKLSDIAAADNSQGLQEILPNYMICPSILYGLGIIDNKEDIRLAFYGEGRHAEINVQPMEMAEIKSKLVSKHKETTLNELLKVSYGLEYLASKQSLYIAYNECTEDPEYPINEFEDDIMKAIDHNPVTKIIVDLRNNTGGYTSVFEPIIQKLESQQKWQGRVLVLIGRRTASAAMFNTIQLRESLGAILIGEPLGGDPRKAVGAETIELPNSGLKVNYSNEIYEVYVEDTGTVFPDVEVKYSLAEIKENHDPVLSAALNYKLH